MEDRTTRDILRRLHTLEQESVRLRKGVVTDTGPLDVDLGGSGVSIEGMPSLAGLPLTTDDVVAALVAGNQMVVLGALGVKIAHGVSAAITVQATSSVTITHGLGVVPHTVLGIVNTGSTRFIVSAVDGITTTQARLWVRKIDGIDASVTVRWLAIA